jgi:micrococcal nuclease
MKWAAIAAALAFLFSDAFANDLPRLSGTVTRVIDGDTLEARLSSGPIRIRLYAIDAPEKRQPSGPDAQQWLTELVAGKAVEIEPHGQDRYNRMVGVVYVNDVNVNEDMVRRGHAWVYRRYARRSDAQYCNFEHAARRAKRGLWSGKAIAPWHWRARSRSSSKARPSQTDYSRETAATCIAGLGK